MKKILLGLLILWIGACKEKYEPPVDSSEKGYLVVDGYINATGAAEIKISRTIPLDDTAHYISEASAQVVLQGNDNSSYSLTEGTTGVYTNNSLALNYSRLYRLYIKTKDGKQYASDYVQVKHAPGIDSLSWAYEREGLQLYINSHDPQNDTWYYRWETDETWEFHSKYVSELKYTYDSLGRVTGIVNRRPDGKPDSTIYTCWKNEQSTNIIIGSSAKLSQDAIHYPIIYIPGNTWKLSVLYSTLITQYAISKDEYEYLQKVKNNSEATGSVFDKQPSKLQGNIHCLSNADEPVLGFIGIADRKQKRFWIKNSDLPVWNYQMNCNYLDDVENQAAFLPLYRSAAGLGTVVLYSDPECVDCRIRGSDVKPSFWP